MADQHMVELRKKVNNVSVHLRYVQAELEMKLGISPVSRRLKNLITEIERFSSYKLDDLLYDYNDINS